MSGGFISIEHGIGRSKSILRKQLCAAGNSTAQFSWKALTQRNKFIGFGGEAWNCQLVGSVGGGRKVPWQLLVGEGQGNLGGNFGLPIGKALIGYKPLGLTLSKGGGPSPPGSPIFGIQGGFQGTNRGISRVYLGPDKGGPRGGHLGFFPEGKVTGKSLGPKRVSEGGAKEFFIGPGNFHFWGILREEEVGHELALKPK